MPQRATKLTGMIGGNLLLFSCPRRRSQRLLELIVTLEGTWVFISIEVAIAPAARWFCPVL